MVFNMKTVFFLALCASSFASPTGTRDPNDIEARMSAS